MGEQAHKLLIVEDDPGLLSQLRWCFEGYDVITAEDRAGAITELRRHEPMVILQDLGLPPQPEGVEEGLATLQETLKLAAHTKVIVVTGHGDQENALKAVALGAYDFYQKPVDTDTLRLLVERAFHMAELEAENRRLQQAAGESPLDGIVAASEGMLAVCRMIEKVAPTDVTTLLLGESGTGKELLARALHRLSPRKDNAFVAINCAAIPENLLESELFGHEKGAFTGAVKTTPGKVEVADGGTLFLDEIGDMPLPLQAKMLRFLQERVIERVGGRQEISVDVRVVCATNQNRDHDQHPAVPRTRRGAPDPRAYAAAEVLQEAGQGVERLQRRRRQGDRVVWLAGQRARTREQDQGRRHHGGRQAGDGCGPRAPGGRR
jgi:two-component system NtrC family response regulator